MRRKEYYIKISIFGEIYLRYFSIKRSVVFLYLWRGIDLSNSLNHDSSLFSTSWSTIKRINKNLPRKIEGARKIIIRHDSLIFSACYVMEHGLEGGSGSADSDHVYIYPFCEMSDNSLKSNYRSGPAWKAPKLAATDGRAARNAFSKFDYDVVHVQRRSLASCRT